MNIKVIDGVWHRVWLRGKSVTNFLRKYLDLIVTVTLILALTAIYVHISTMSETVSGMLPFYICADIVAITGIIYGAVRLFQTQKDIFVAPLVTLFAAPTLLLLISLLAVDIITLSSLYRMGISPFMLPPWR